MSGEIARLLAEARGKAPYTTGELVAEAAKLIPRLAPEQTRYKVTEYPDERTIRYYVVAGLLEPPTERRGRIGLFSFRHLLQVLAIKKLQAEYLPLRKIQEVIRPLDDAKLMELLLKSGEYPVAGTEGMRLAHPSYRMRRMAQADRDSVAENVSRTMRVEKMLKESSLAREPGISTERFAPHGRAALPPSHPEAETQASPSGEEWARVTLADGIEVHIRTDSAAAAGREERENLVAKLRVCLAKHMKRKR